MGFFELFEVGFFTAFWNFSNPFLSIPIYLCVLIGFAVQLVLHKKCRNSSRWFLMGACAVGIVASEYAWQVITGWDRLAIDIIYGLIVCLLLGTLLATLLHLVITQKRAKGDK